MCCITQARPCEVGALPLGRSSGLAGAPCIMQDTRNSYLEAERRSLRKGIYKGVAWAGGGRCGFEKDVLVLLFLLICPNVFSTFVSSKPVFVLD